MTDVLIADDHPVVLRGFRRLMEEASDVCLHEATDPIGAYRIFHRLRPAVVVTDLTFQGDGLAGLSLIRRIHALDRQARILAFSMHHDPVIAARALENGAIGYVFKDAGTAELLRAFEAVRTGTSYLDHALATRVALLNAVVHRTPSAELNARELQVLLMLGKGMTYVGIADALFIKYRTVLTLCAGMRRKLGVRSLAELIQIAIAQRERDSA